ncbi:MAG TPA: DUF4175 family protein, partial [Pyrinomonadaceae bacterium]|nr:DUF4175 family protein [Pyrinomonadaceae bacterium]
MCSRLGRLHFRRRLFQAIARGATITACALFVLCLFAFVDYQWSLTRPTRTVLLFLTLVSALLLLAHTLWLLLRKRTLAQAAREIERAAGSRGNSLVTLAETLKGDDEAGARSYMFARLEGQARLELSNMDERVVAPRAGSVRGAGALALVLLLLLSLRLVAYPAFTREAGRVLLLVADNAAPAKVATGNAANLNEGSGPASIKESVVRVLPPAYSGLTAEEVTGDAPVRVLAGSQIEVILNTNGAVAGASLSFNGSANTMRSLGEGRFSGTFMAMASGAFEARLLVDEDGATPSVVRAVEVYNDIAPEARIIEPASDQLLRAVPTAPVVVRWMASDDLGLAGVALKYIKSRGEGDSAKFTNGEVSVGNVERAGAREWRGTSVLDLGRLDMQPGDTLVFWLEARDRRADGNNTGRSASLAIAISAPELAKLNLSDLMPNEIGRFLLSERQIIIHTEKLHNERARLAPAELKRRAGDIAAEQRDFKNSFNDYIKVEGEGEVEQTGTNASAPTIEERVRAAEDERTAPHFHGIPEPPSGAATSVKEMTY